MIKKFHSFNEGKKDKFPNIKKVEMDGFVVYIGRDDQVRVDYLNTDEIVI